MEENSSTVFYLASSGYKKETTLGNLVQRLIECDKIDIVLNETNKNTFLASVMIIRDNSRRHYSLQDVLEAIDIILPTIGNSTIDGVGFQGDLTDLRHDIKSLYHEPKDKILELFTEERVSPNWWQKIGYALDNYAQKRACAHG